MLAHYLKLADIVNGQRILSSEDARLSHTGPKIKGVKKRIQGNKEL